MLLETLRAWPRATTVLTVTIIACAVYANLSLLVVHGADYRYFPPFKRFVNANSNDHLGGEYFHMARALVAGDGLAHPFDQRTGPTAWQPPVLPAILAGLLVVCAGSRTAVAVVVVVFQVAVLVFTGLVVLAVTRQTRRRVGAATAVAVFLGALGCHFSLCFQTTHDSWLVLLTLDLLLAGLCWGKPLERWLAAIGWGLFGGLSTLINPVVGFVWGTASALLASRTGAWHRLAVVASVAGLTLMPWIVRNYLLFGRFIPAKSNLAYELYQSQCLQPDGLIQATTFRHHPYGSATRERREYQSLGEMAFLDRKREQFVQAVRADWTNFVERVAHRLLGTTLWYVPFDRPVAAKRPWSLWLGRLTHPLPLLGLLVLLVAATRGPLHPAEWAILGVYLLYLLPYIGASYYERYGMPLLGVKVLLVICAIDRLLSLRPGSTGRGLSVPSWPRAAQQQPAVSSFR